MYELRNATNNYKTSYDIKYCEGTKIKHEKVYKWPEEKVSHDILEEVYGLDSSFVEILNRRT